MKARRFVFILQLFQIRQISNKIKRRRAAVVYITDSPALYTKVYAKSHFYRQRNEESLQQK